MTLVSIVILVKDVDELGCKFWMQTRSEAGVLDGLLEFPGGKIQATESPRECAIREFSEEAQVTLSHVEQFKMISHKYDDREVCLYVHLSNGKGVNPLSGAWHDFLFVGGASDYKGRLPDANYEIIDELLKYIKKHNEAGLLEKIWVRKS